MISALVYLSCLSWWNRLLSRLKRLRQPKYLLGGLVGGAYFFFFFIRPFVFQPAAPGMALLQASAALAEGVAALIVFGIVLLGWIVPRQRAALVFTEAEIHFLFPAPISRRGLIHYKLIKSQIGILVTTAFFTLLWGRMARGGNAWTHAVGWWLMLSTLNLHFLGASFVLTLLLDRGITNWQRRLAIFGGMALAAAGVFWWARVSLPMPVEGDFIGPDAMLAYGEQLLQSGPVPWLLLPFRFMVRPFLATDAGAFAVALLPLAALFGLHYVWVMRANVAFEEASLDLSRKVAEQMAAARAGNLQHRPDGAGRRRDPFRLRPEGLPAVAIFWKNLISLTNAFSPRLWIVIAVMTGIFAMTGAHRAARGFADFVSLLCLVFGGWSVLIGPQILRQDLRQDLAQADQLKLFPLPGWQVVLGEILAPLLVLTLAQWFLLALGTFTFKMPADALGAGSFAADRWSYAAGVAVLLPTANALLFCIPNAAVLLFPAWFQASRDGAHGIEAMGQRLIFVFGQWLALIVALIPAGIVAAAAFFLASMAVGGTLAIPVAGVFGSAALGLEAAVAVYFLGRWFEKFDVSAEPVG